MTTLLSTKLLRARPKAGFTLVEMIVVVFISTLIVGGVMAIFLFITKSGIRTQHYRDMDNQARQALEYLSRDMRMASDILWTGSANTTTKIRLTVPTGWSTATNEPINSHIYYRLVPVAANSPLQTKLGPQFMGRFVTAEGSADPDTDGTSDEEQYSALQTHIATSGLEFRKFKLGSLYVEIDEESGEEIIVRLPEIKQVKLELKAERKSVLVADATQYVMSARFVLRNKVVAR